MPQQPQQDDAALIADLNDLLQLDHDAVEAYTLAIDVVRSDRYREALVVHRADHKRHIEELAALVRKRGGLPTELPHPTAPLKLVVQALGAAPNDQTLLLAFKAVERQVRDKYGRFAAKRFPEDVREVVQRAADDEVRHYQWAEDSLRELGAGAGTLPHALGSALENVHKVLADPVEAAGRRVMEQVGALVGTTKRRAGGAAPSPAAAAEGAADRAAGLAADAVDAADGGGIAGVPGPDASRFIAALRALEQDRDLEPMLALYEAHSETTGPTDEASHIGHEGGRHFWHMYRDSFEHVESTFTNVVDDGAGTVMLEWTSRGTTTMGVDVRYAGVSVVEMAGGRIHRFRTYFNPRDLDVGEAPRGRASANTETGFRRDADLGGEVVG